ncbi:hypothetical protein [Microcoleus sp. FACHB-68]|uniref:hypothetical protein n=1 Tax=Microcoleus sp. FACHB-68 TaxID=2692826 RepID=UPI001689FB7B|nr:hypothetical protein [Microcoleus sp. FACHB-68]
MGAVIAGEVMSRRLSPGREFTSSPLLVGSSNNKTITTAGTNRISLYLTTMGMLDCQL